MMQRILAIDRNFLERDRVYLHLAFFRHWRLKEESPAEGVTLYRANVLRHIRLALSLGRQAACIFVHSAHNALRGLVLYRFPTVVTDMHGVFSEELAYAGKPLGALLYRMVERRVIAASRAIVTVTDAMARHYEERFGRSLARYIIPVFSPTPLADVSVRGAGDCPRVIYAGGGQSWQKVDLMLDAMVALRNRCCFTILSPDLSLFREELARRGLVEEVDLRTVPSSEVYGAYAQADYGFILRDDTVVNRVACPTKLVEYMQCGVVPIVLQPEIGDFAAAGYAYLTLDRFLAEDIPSADELDQMRLRNLKVVANLAARSAAELERLKTDCAG